MEGGGIFYARNQMFRVDTDLVFMNIPTENVFFLTILNAPMWFLPALFLLLIIADFIRRITKNNTKEITICLGIGLLGFLLYHYTNPLLLPWCIDSMPVLLIYFYVGYFLNKSQAFTKVAQISKTKRYMKYSCLFVMTVVVCFVNSSINISIGFFGNSVILAILSGLGASILVLIICKWIQDKYPKIAVFVAKLSPYSLSILCLHYLDRKSVV